MRALPPRDRRRETRKAFARRDMRTSNQQSVARCNKLGLQIDLESSSVKARTLISGVAEADCAFLRKIFSATLSINSRSTTSRTLCALGAIRTWRFAGELFENAIELR